MKSFCCYMVLTIVIGILLYQLIKKTLENSYKEKKIKALRNREKMVRQYYQLAEKNNEQLRKIRHDIKNQLQIAYLVAKQNQTKGIEMIDMINQKLEEINQIYYCGNKILNVILAIEAKKAKQNDIDINIKVDNEIDLNMEETDICSMFTNLLDNSIEAAKQSKNKKIKFCILKKFNCIVIKCENTYSIKPKKDEDSNFITTKLNKNYHGYGIRILKDIVKKYGGEIDFLIKNQVFEIIILFDVTQALKK